MNGIASTERPRRTLLVLLSLLALGACTGPNALVVAIEGGDRTLAVGDDLALAAIVTGGPAVVAWTSTVPSVAAVDGAGVVTGIAAGTTTVRATSVADASASDAIEVTVVPAGEVHWTRQFGTGGDDRAYAATIDASGRVFVAGGTSGALAGANAGDADAYVRGYAADGATVLWTSQFGTAGTEFANGLATGPGGAILVTGHTTGALAGPHAGFEDVFVRSYDGAGGVSWTRQFGTASADLGYAVAVAADGRVVVAGSTSGVLEGPGFGGLDGFVRVLDAAGDLVWTRQFGTAATEYAVGVAVAADGRVLVAGHTMGDLAAPNLGGFDAFLRAYDEAGDLLWTRQFGTAATDAAVAGVAVDALGRAFVAGRTLGALDGPHLGGGDAFVRAYEADGTLAWGTQFGTPADEQVGQVALDDVGNVFVVGETEGDLGAPNQGLGDAFVRKLAATGALRWTRPFGTPSADGAAAAAADGRVAVVGQTRGDLAGPNAGSNDGFVRVFGP
jgi:hypothetical protein